MTVLKPEAQSPTCLSFPTHHQLGWTAGSGPQVSSTVQVTSRHVCACGVAHPFTRCTGLTNLVNHAGTSLRAVWVQPSQHSCSDTEWESVKESGVPWWRTAWLSRSAARVCPVSCCARMTLFVGEETEGVRWVQWDLLDLATDIKEITSTSQSSFRVPDTWRMPHKNTTYGNTAFRNTAFRSTAFRNTAPKSRKSGWCRKLCTKNLVFKH